tara:strand:+ start:8837 stop:11074 length:2238 start_codon:yes stop_codon:yes gene_type:complete
MIVERGRNRGVIVRYRDELDDRQEYHIKDCYPYCFVKDEDSLTIPNAIRREGGYTGLYGENLTKLTFGDPAEVGKLKNDYPNVQTWEANIPFVNRVLADIDWKPANYRHRIWFLDCEWKVESGEITIITIRDSYSNKLYVLFHHTDYEKGFYDTIPCKNHPEGKTEISFAPRARAFDGEADMLRFFANMMARQDPDVITGWNVVNADCRMIFDRMKKCNLDPRSLSPFKRVRYEFGDWAQPIVGRNVIDLMLTFTRLWVIKNGQLPNNTLGDVSQHCLKDTKVKLKDGHDTYYTDIGTYLDYAAKDTLLLPRLNALNNAIEHHLALQHIVGCDIRSTPFITRMFTSLALSDPNFTKRIPTKPQFEKVKYDGADIGDPDAGVYEDIAILDVRAMYHANVERSGICWTTLDPEGDDCGNGICFRRGEKGLLCRQMDNMTGLRDKYKALMKNAKTESERRKYDSLQYATKSLVASMYGVAGDAKYALYHPDIAASITYTSRQTLSRLGKACEGRGHKVIYYHTDSAFVEIGSPEEAQTLIREINDEMKPIVVEFEKFCESFLITASNRYAAKVCWSEGERHEPYIYYKGIEIKQARLPKAMKETVGNVIDSILCGTEEREVTRMLEDYVNSLVKGELPVEDLLIRGKLNEDLSKYKSLGEARAGAAWANDMLGKGYRKGDYFFCTLNERGEYIAFDDPSEIDGIAKIGYRHLADRFIVRKVEKYYHILGWDMIPISNALEGKTGIGWL